MPVSSRRGWEAELGDGPHGPHTFVTRPVHTPATTLLNGTSLAFIQERAYRCPLINSSFLAIIGVDVSLPARKYFSPHLSPTRPNSESSCPRPHRALQISAHHHAVNFACEAQAYIQKTSNCRMATEAADKNIVDAPVIAEPETVRH